MILHKYSKKVVRNHLLTDNKLKIDADYLCVLKSRIFATMRFFQNILLIAGLITGNMLFAQNRIVKGTVTDLEDGSPIIGAGVMSGKNQTATDLEGRFSISVEPGERLIRFNEIGYYTVTLVIPDSQDTEMAVSLRQTVILDMWNRPLSEKKLLSYSPNVNLDLPDVHRIKVQTRRFVPKKKLVRAIYGKKPYNTAVSVLFEDKNGRKKLFAFF